MILKQLLDMQLLNEDLKNRKISMNLHPSLPIAILNYTNECMFDNYWPETVQICRGLIIEVDPATYPNISGECRIISRPFHKFFGLDHDGQDDYILENLPKVIPTVTDKVDGWMGVLWNYTSGQTGEVHWGVASRGSFISPGASFATEKLHKLIKYGAIEEFPKGYTPVFEIIFKAGRIVIQYPFEGLVLLGCVNNETGEELSYDQLREVWSKIATYSLDKPWIRLVHAHNMTLTECLADKRTDREGYVLSYSRPGTYPIKVKVKLEEYKRLHRLITGVTAQQIWRSMSDPTFELLKDPIPTHFRRWVVGHQDSLNRRFLASLVRALRVSTQLRMDIGDLQDKQNRAVVMQDLLSIAEPSLAGLVLMILEGKVTEAFHSIWSSIRPQGRELDVFKRDSEGE